MCFFQYFLQVITCIYAKRKYIAYFYFIKMYKGEREMTNICRPFILCNDFIPPAKGVHQGWKFLSFGYLDGILVEDNVFKKNTVSLLELWNHYQQQSEKLNGSYLPQIIFGMRYETPIDEVKDDKFWNAPNLNIEFPFIFITLVQIDKKEMNTASVKTIRTSFEREINQIADVRAITYLTFDTSDFILVLRSKNYKCGVSIINRLQGDIGIIDYKRKLKYTFTVASVHKDFITSEYMKELKDSIDTAYIYLIQKASESTDDIYKFLKAECDKIENSTIFKKQSVLGCNDEVIILNNIPWNMFLNWYQDNSGILNHSSTRYQNSLNGVTTIIGMNQEISGTEVSFKPQDSQIFDVSSDLSPNKEPEKEKILCEQMRKRCQSIIEPLINKGIDFQSFKKYFYQIINTLQKFEKTQFTDYLFMPIVLPLNMLLNMVEEWSSDQNIEDFLESIYSIMKGLSLYTQNTIRSDRQFVQTPDFNAKIYDVPPKINAFYNAYIYFLKKYLNCMVEQSDQSRNEQFVQHEYEFLLCAGVASNLRVKEFFKPVSKTNRLFLIECPEENMFEPKIMLTILSHELGHVVGSGIRNRIQRFNHSKVIVGKVVSNYIKNGLIEYFKRNKEEWEYINNNGEYWTKFEKDIVQLFENYPTEKHVLNKKDFLTSEGEWEVIPNILKAREFHSELVQRELCAGVKKYLVDNRSVIWGYLLEKEYLYWLEHDPKKAEMKKKEMESYLNDLVYYMESGKEWNSYAMNLRNTISVVFNLFQECLSDIICILTLHLSFKEYLETINWKVAQLGYKTLNGTEMMIRCMLVVYSMQYESEKACLGFRWKDKELHEINELNVNVSIRNLKNEIMEQLEKYMGNKQSLQKKCKAEELSSSIDMFFDSSILSEMAKYLLECTEKFASYHANSDLNLNEQRKALENIYKQFDGNNIEDIVDNIQNYIEKYLAELQVKYNGMLTEEKTD